MHGCLAIPPSTILSYRHMTETNVSQYIHYWDQSGAGVLAMVNKSVAGGLRDKLAATPTLTVHSSHHPTCCTDMSAATLPQCVCVCVCACVALTTLFGSSSNAFSKA